jgi:hypothetical protein
VPFPLVELRLPVVGGPVPAVGHPVSLISDLISPVSNEIALVSGPSAFLVARPSGHQTTFHCTASLCYQYPRLGPPPTRLDYHRLERGPRGWLILRIFSMTRAEAELLLYV